MADIYRQLFDNKQGKQSEISVGNNTASVTFDAGPSVILDGVELPTPVLLDVEVQGGQKMEDRAPFVTDGSGQIFLLFYDEQGGIQAIDAAQVRAEIQPAVLAARQMYAEGKDPRTGAPISAKDPVTGREIQPGGISSHLYKVNGEMHTAVLLDREGKYVRHYTQGRPMMGDGTHIALVPVDEFDLHNPPQDKVENAVRYDDGMSPLRYTAGADDGVKQYMENLEAYADAMNTQGGITLGTTDDVAPRDDNERELVSKGVFPALPDHKPEAEPAAAARPTRERPAPVQRERPAAVPERPSPAAERSSPRVTEASGDAPDASIDPVAAMEAIADLLRADKRLYGPEIGKIAATGDRAFRSDVAAFAREHARNPELSAKEYFDAKNAPEAAPEPARPAEPSRAELRQIDLPPDFKETGPGIYMNPTDAANLIRRDLTAGLAESGSVPIKSLKVLALEEAVGDVKSLFPAAVDDNGRIDAEKLPEAVRDALGSEGLALIDEVNMGLDCLQPDKQDVRVQPGICAAPLPTPQ